MVYLTYRPEDWQKTTRKGNMMGVLYTCDMPDNDEDPIKSDEALEIQVTYSDPENGVSQATKVFCAKHGDEVLAQLTEFGFPSAS